VCNLINDRECSTCSPSQTLANHADTTRVCAVGNSVTRFVSLRDAQKRKDV